MEGEGEFEDEPPQEAELESLEVMPEEEEDEEDEEDEDEEGGEEDHAILFCEPSATTVDRQLIKGKRLDAEYRK